MATARWGRWAAESLRRVPGSAGNADRCDSTGQIPRSSRDPSMRLRCGILVPIDSPIQRARPVLSSQRAALLPWAASCHRRHDSLRVYVAEVGIASSPAPASIVGPRGFLRTTNSTTTLVLAEVGCGPSHPRPFCPVRPSQAPSHCAAAGASGRRWKKPPCPCRASPPPCSRWPASCALDTGPSRAARWARTICHAIPAPVRPRMSWCGIVQVAPAAGDGH